MKYWQKFSPRGTVDALSDLFDYWRQPTPYRWQILGASVALTFTLMVLFLPETEYKDPARPEVTYISTFDPDRTDAEIRASNLENQKRKEARAAEAAARRERKREAAKALGRATWIDVDAMERQAERDRAKQEAAAAAEQARLRARVKSDE
jgi:hypothetical protein